MGPNQASRQVWLSLLWDQCSFPLKSLGTSKILFEPSKTGVSFPQSRGSPVIKSCWPSKSDSLGIPTPFAGSPGWKGWHGAQNLLNSGRMSLILLFSCLWVAHLECVGFYFIMIVLLLPSHCGFFFAFGHGVYSFGGFQCPPINGCSAASCNFGALPRGDEHTSFSSTILNQVEVCNLPEK